MIRMMRGLAAGAALALATVSSGCAGYGWEDGYGGGGWGSPSEVRGQVEGVQTRLHTIQLRRDNGRRAVVHFDSRTEVVYGDRRERPESLDRGDYVSMRVSRDSRGRLYTRHVTVRHEVRDVYRGDRDRDRDRVGDRDRRHDDDDRYDRRDRRDDDRYDARAVEGRVGRVDRSGRRFELRSDRGTVWVTVARDASRGVRDRFARLREGDRVRVTGRYVGRDRFEMEQFR
ncbi:MAG TPA: hypothetical protein VFT45_17595 [Longimicrobium sp.]|nr:hypothetical protein [Longimicrobium sp.]